MAAVVASLFAEFRFLSREDQHAIARRAFLAFDVTDDGGAIAGRSCGAI
jgi:hypothetical protein